MTTRAHNGQDLAEVDSHLGKSAGLLDLLVEQVLDYAIFVIDTDGCIASWNPGAQRIKGYTPEEIIGQSYSVFFLEEDRATGRPQQILAHARAEGRFHEEAWRMRKDGTAFFASITLTALRDAKGELCGFAKITHDLTERRRADEEARRSAEERAARRQAELDEREVRRSRDQLNLILQSIGEGVTVQSPEGDLIFVNDAAARLCGFDSATAMLACPRSAILGRFEVAREDGTPLPWEQLPGRRALEGVASTRVVRFRATGSGEERWSIVSGAPVLDRDGKVEMAVTVFREFTERRRTEQAWRYLADTAAALGTSLDHKETLHHVATLAVPEIADWCSVDVLTADGRLDQLAVAYANDEDGDLAREWRRRCSRGDDWLSQRVLRSGTPELLANVTPEVIAAIADPEQRELVERVGPRSAIVVPLMVGDRPLGVISFVMTRSGRRYRAEDLILTTEIGRRASLAIENARAYTEAKMAIQTRDNFLAIASHELRTPLSALSVLLTSLLRAAHSGKLMQLGAEGLQERLTRAERQTKQLARLVDRLLDVSRLSNRDLQLERETMDLGQLLRDVALRYEDAAAEARSRIDVQVDSGPVMGFWDRGRLDQVVTNLIANAIKYAEGAAITVTLTPDGTQWVRLTVSDAGPGIPVEEHERIFEQYERATHGDSIPGMGLGLWLVKRIVTAHGGTVTLDSKPGAGASFSVVLPTGNEDRGVARTA